MTLEGFLRLAAQSVTAPRDVARLLLSLRLGQEALLTAFALVVVLNALMLGLSGLAVPADPALPGFLTQPALFLGVQALALAGTIAAVTGLGRVFGAEADPARVAVVLIWLQALRVLVQALLLLVLPLSAGLASLIQVAGSILGVWIVVHFIDEALALDSLFKAAAVLILGVLAMAFGLSILLSLMGVSPEGMNNYV